MSCRQSHHPSIQHLLLCALTLMLSLSACKTFDDEPFDAVTNYQALWETLDQRYCFFDYKQINWDSLYPVYLQKTKQCRTSYELFDVFTQLMSHLKDGHVNLVASFDIGRYWSWYLDYPSHFSQEMIDQHYLKRDYRIAGGMDYTKIGEERNIGYIQYLDFSSGFSASGLHQIFTYFEDCKGLIIDVRQNGGGNLMYSEFLAGCFTDTAFVYGYAMHKTGPEHDAFSEPYPKKIYPNTVRWRKPVVLLTNRRSYSTTNNFAYIMKQIDLCTLMGDQTGGGSGMPIASELPNGWTFRYSAIPHLDAQKNHVEFGVEPDIYVTWDSPMASQGKDAIIERAIGHLLAL